MGHLYILKIGNVRIPLSALFDSNDSLVRYGDVRKGGGAVSRYVSYCKNWISPRILSAGATPRFNLSVDAGLGLWSNRKKQWGRANMMKNPKIWRKRLLIRKLNANCHEQTLFSLAPSFPSHLKQFLLSPLHSSMHIYISIPRSRTVGKSWCGLLVRSL